MYAYIYIHVYITPKPCPLHELTFQQEVERRRTTGHLLLLPPPLPLCLSLTVPLRISSAQLQLTSRRHDRHTPSHNIH